MADDKTKKGPADAARVNVNEAFEVSYWTHKWGVSAEALKAASKKAGPMAADIARELGK